MMIYKRRTLPEDHAAFREIVNYDNTLVQAFGFVNQLRPEAEFPSVKIEPVKGGTLDAFADMCAALNRTRFYATNRLENYVSKLANPDARTFDIIRAQGEFYAAYGVALQQMQALSKTFATARRFEKDEQDEGVTITFTYLDEHGTEKQAKVAAFSNPQPIYDALSYLRSTGSQKSIRERQFYKDIERIEEAVKPYQPHNAQVHSYSI